MLPANDDSTGDYERLLAASGAERFVLRLFVSGMTPRSTDAIERTKQVCEEHLQGRYELEVIDVYQNPALAVSEQIIAVPTLMKQLPAPLRRLVGDLSDKERVLVGLGLKKKS
ncbi:MAG TPA: circadian clock KaiB family protein [Planctomycetaceae bacterium]|nr:circadian clock KaiB family protein [Planctomycetaceae bacterium]